MTLVKPADFVRINFWMNFRETVYEWRTVELADIERKKTKFGKNADE